MAYVYSRWEGDPWNRAQAERQKQEILEKQRTLQGELQEFAKDATIGSPKLLAIHYRRQIVEADIEIEKLEHAMRKFFGADRKTVVALEDAKKRREHIEKNEIPLQEVMIDGFATESAQLTPITEGLLSVYNVTAVGHDTKSLGAKNLLLDDLNRHRNAGINRPAQGRESTPPQE